MTANTPAPVRDRTTRRLVGVSLAYFMVLLDITVLAVAEPDIMRSLHTGVIGVGWATTTYTMALAAALVLAGSLSDRLGAYPLFLTGVGCFGALSVGCAVAPTLPALLVLRGLLGLSAALIVPSSLSLIAALYPERQGRGRAISAWAAISGAAMAAGPVLGGWLVGFHGWRAVFLINGPLSLAVLVLCRNPIPTPRRDVSLSWLPHLGLATTLAALTLAVTQAGQRSWTPALLLVAFLLLALYATAVVDRRSPAPLIPEPLRRSTGAWVAFAWAAAANYALTSVVFSIPLLLHATPTKAGATLLPMTVLIAVNPLVTGRLAASRGSLLPIRMGFAAFPAGLCLTAIAFVNHRAPVIGAGLLLCGFGVSWTLPALVGFAVDEAPAEVTGAVGGLLNASRQVGATLAAAVASASLTRSTSGPWVAVPFVIASAFCLACLASATFRHGRRRAATA